MANATAVVIKGGGDGGGGGGGGGLAEAASSPSSAGDLARYACEGEGVDHGRHLRLISNASGTKGMPRRRNNLFAYGDDEVSLSSF